MRVRRADAHEGVGTTVASDRQGYVGVLWDGGGRDEVEEGSLRMAPSLPPYWLEGSCSPVACPVGVIDAVQALFDKTYRRAWTKDRPKRSIEVDVPTGYAVRTVARNQNVALWARQRRYGSGRA